MNDVHCLSATGFVKRTDDHRRLTGVGDSAEKSVFMTFASCFAGYIDGLAGCSADLRDEH
jgi:hypothetical protein